MKRLIVGLVVMLVGEGQAAIIDSVTIGNPGNTADSTSYGAVDYTYSVGMYEVTAGQYTEFLNAIADTDTFGLYHPNMNHVMHPIGCGIQRLGLPGNYTYSVAPDRANRPVNYVSWGDAVRFANWLHNGQPTGGQNESTTEGGSYFLNGAENRTDLLAVTRQAGATWVIPTQDEWYKAAYHKNDGVTGNYWDYPTSSDSEPSHDLIDPDPGNNANFYTVTDGYTLGAPYWRTEVGEFENSESPYGTFDQGGNQWEWTEGVINAAHIVRGGTSDDILLYLQASSSYPWPAPPSEGHAIGFRVASVVPEPGSRAMWAGLALMGLLYWRRK